MLDFLGSIVEGGFDIVENITTGVGEGFERFSSGFFPSPQRQTPITISQQAPVVNTGKSYRPTSAEPQSALETAAQAAVDWMDSPYEEQYGPSEMDQRRSENWLDPWGDMLGDIVGAAGETFTKINEQLPEILMRKWGVIPEQQHQNTQGEIVYQVYTDPNAIPATVSANQAGQPKGTFNLGFLTDWLKIPAAPIPTPTAAQVKQVAGISVQTIALVAVAALIFIGLKKI